MNDATTVAIEDNDQDRGVSVGQTTRPTVEKPVLESIVQAVCLDAQHESLKFILRSDTGHDGE